MTAGGGSTIPVAGTVIAEVGAARVPVAAAEGTGSAAPGAATGPERVAVSRVAGADPTAVVGVPRLAACGSCATPALGTGAG